MAQSDCLAICLKKPDKVKLKGIDKPKHADAAEHSKASSLLVRCRMDSMQMVCSKWHIDGNIGNLQKCPFSNSAESFTLIILMMCFVQHQKKFLYIR